jgi:hypothetical protein
MIMKVACAYFGSVRVLFLGHNHNEDMEKKRVEILVDGSNFYHLVLKKINLDETQFDFEKFATFLADGRAVSDKGKRFYTGTVSEREQAYANSGD